MSNPKKVTLYSRENPSPFERGVYFKRNLKIRNWDFFFPSGFLVTNNIFLGKYTHKRESRREREREGNYIISRQIQYLLCVHAKVFERKFPYSAYIENYLWHVTCDTISSGFVVSAVILAKSFCYMNSEFHMFVELMFARCVVPVAHLMRNVIIPIERG